LRLDVMTGRTGHLAISCQTVLERLAQPVTHRLREWYVAWMNICVIVLADMAIPTERIDAFATQVERLSSWCAAMTCRAILGVPMRVGYLLIADFPVGDQPGYLFRRVQQGIATHPRRIKRRSGQGTKQDEQKPKRSTNDAVGCHPDRSPRYAAWPVTGHCVRYHDPPSIGVVLSVQLPPPPPPPPQFV